MRFEARHLEVEGKLQDALEICRDILRHVAHEPASEQTLPVFVQASELSVKVGDREGGTTLLLLAAERYAEAGLARPVLDLYQRLRRLGPARQGLDLQFARRMLAHRHPAAAREFLTELARRQKKERLLATLERMAAWSDDKIQHQLTEFLDRAEGLRVSAAQPSLTAAPPPAPSAEVTEVRPAVPAPESPPPAPPPEPPPQREPVVESPRGTAPRTGIRTDARPGSPAPPAFPVAAGVTPPASRDGGPRGAMPADDVVFVTPAAPQRPSSAAPSPAPKVTRPPLVPPPRRRSRSRVTMAAIVGGTVVVLGAAAALVVPRLGRDLATSVRPSSTRDTTPVPGGPAVPDSGPAPVRTDAVATAAEPDSGRPTLDAAATATLPLRGAVAAAAPSTVPPPPRDQATALRPPPATAVTVPVTTPVATPTRPRPADSARPPVAEPPAVVAPARAIPSPSSAVGVDYTVVIVDGLEIVGITREGEGSTGRILVRQVLPSGDTLELRESDLGEASVGVGVGRVLVGRHPSGGAMGTVRVGRYLVSARAPVAPELLEPWLQKLIERVPG